MQYFHQARYGHAGAAHTAKPLYVMKHDNRVYTTAYHPQGEGSKAIFAMRDNKLYATADHPQGESPHALYEIRGDKVHTTEHHPDHNPTSHIFELKQQL